MILIQRKLAGGKRRLILPSMIDHDIISPKFKVKSCDEVKRHFLVIARLGEGDCFGVGEDLTKMYIISLKKVGGGFSTYMKPLHLLVLLVLSQS